VLFQLIVRMELKDKLQRLRRERESRLKSHRVSSTWEEIDKKEGLSTKEKLQRLIQLTRDEGQQKPQAPAFEPVPREPLQFSENPFSLDMRYGRIQLSEGLDISGHILTCLSGDSVFESLDLSKQTQKLLSTLTPREEKILRMRFGIGEKTDYTLEEVGKQFGISRERVRQIEERALRKLRHPLKTKEMRQIAD